MSFELQLETPLQGMVLEPCVYGLRYSWQSAPCRNRVSVHLQQPSPSPSSHHVLDMDLGVHVSPSYVRMAVQQNGLVVEGLDKVLDSLKVSCHIESMPWNSQRICEWVQQHVPDLLRRQLTPRLSLVNLMPLEEFVRSTLEFSLFYVRWRWGWGMGIGIGRVGDADGWL